jgi:outer membrane protein insertion porin family
MLVGVKLFRTPEAILPQVFGMGEGDVFSIAKLRKGLEEMRKLYGEFGYIDFVPEPDPSSLNQRPDKIDLTLNVDEGKQFFVRRIDFSGNTTTRDKVIRREILLDEGDQCSTPASGNSALLRLNQLGYFEALKEVRSRRHQARHPNQHRRHHPQGEGARQELRSAVGRRLRHRRQLRFGSVTRPTTSSASAKPWARAPARRPYPRRDVRLHGTLSSSTSPSRLGFTVYMQRFNYDQGREVSLSLRPQPDSQVQGARQRQPVELFVPTAMGFTAFASTVAARASPASACHLRL